MKSTRLFLPAALICSLALALCPTSGRAAGEKEEKAHETAAEDVLKAMHMEAFFETTTERMLTQLDRLSENAARQAGNTPESVDFQARMHAQVRERVKKDFNWSLLKPDFLKIYSDLFSTQELKELGVFYASPLGQKLLEKQGELSTRMGEASQERARTVLPPVVQMVRDEAAKLPPAAASAPGAQPSVMPAASPADAAKPAATASPAKP